MDDAVRLESRAVGLMKAGDFGEEAVRVNQAIVELAPKNDRAWTRLGRCLLEQRRFDEAIEALRTALSLNGANTVATNLLTEVRKRRAMTPTAAERATTGFTPREFAVLETHAPADACVALRPRLESLFDAVNATSIAARIVEARQRQGAGGSKLFHANSCHAGALGHIYAFQHGGRWEPQFSLAWFAPPSMPGCMRIGIGFNTSAAGRDVERDAGHEQVLRAFERFQRTVAKSWRSELARWMGGNTGFVQIGAEPPSQTLQPAQAVDWLINCRNAAAVEWIFVGRWLFLDRPDAAAIMRDRSTLARTVDDTFRALFPLWLSAYSGTD
ncbi:MAG TPA: tetratricopeptide repeat protein [Vicinamibacterales bacterium]|nr:tetratricopeptide repeat protein [Vicinamibacterales bacterium]